MKSFATRLKEVKNSTSPKKQNNTKNKGFLTPSAKHDTKTIEQVNNNFKKNYQDLKKTLRLFDNLHSFQHNVRIQKQQINTNRQISNRRSMIISPKNRSNNKLQPTTPKLNQNFTKSVIFENTSKNANEQKKLNSANFQNQNKFNTNRSYFLQKEKKKSGTEPRPEKISMFREIVVKEIEKSNNESIVKRGIPNIGNTCYINATVQCLFHLPNFNKIFQVKRSEEFYKILHPKHRNAAVRYRELLLSIEEARTQEISSYHLKRAVSKKCSLFVEWEQQDAHEFIRQLLEALHDDLNRVQEIPPYRQLEANRKQRVLTSLAIEYWNYYKSRDNSHIIDYFCGQILSSVVCLGCQYESLSFDNFLDLSVSMLKGKTSLQELIQNFVKKEQLPDPYFCSKCKKYNKSTRKLDLWKVPKLLMVQLKRFRFGRYKTEKIRDRISFPLQNLNIKRLMNISNDNSASIAMYDLCGYVCHLGSMEQGHYYAIVKDIKTNRWYKIDDEDIKQMNEKKMEQQLSENQFVFMLFYNRKDNK